MKKWWVVLAAALLTLGYWTSAGAEMYHCIECGELTSRTYVDCGPYHQSTCIECGSTEEEKHLVYCAGAAECRKCGNATDMNDDIIEHARSWKYLDETHHLTSCECGFFYDKVEHYFDGYGVASYDNVYHMKSCICSKDMYELSVHTAYCNKDDSVCSLCDETNVKTEKIHYLSRVVDLGLYHQWMCAYCDYGGAQEEHVVVCDNPGYCYYCNLDAIDMPVANMLHREATVEYYITADTHQFHCTNCEALYDAEAHDFDGGVCILCEYEKGSMQPALPGDADNSTVVTVEDAITILQYLSGEAVTINMVNADVNADTVVDMDDVLLLLQYTAGWDVTLE